jgi:hypothetical protein
VGGGGVQADAEVVPELPADGARLIGLGPHGVRVRDGARGGRLTRRVSRTLQRSN